MRFSPAFFAEISNIDDADLIADLARKSTWSFNELFGPGSASGLYYRPIIGLTHYADRFLFNLNPVILHAENILLHAANATLVFFLTRFFLQAPGGSFAALFAASLFAVHPLTTESTNWISGRTDVLAGFFVLASALSLIRFQSRKDPFALLLFASFFAAAMLTKEVSLAFLPGACLLFLATQGTASSGKRSLKQAVFIVALGVFAILTFFWLRSLTAASNQSRIGLTLMVISNDFWYSLYICLRSLGFYFAKIVAPVPLNFAIMEVDPLYALAGVPLACISIFILFRKGPVSALFSSGLFLIAPAFLIAFGQIAWTPYAERYLYMPLMFIIPAFVLFLNKHLVFPAATLKTSLCLALVLVFSVLTFNRNLVWRTNETLISDTLEKSPLSGRLWSVYAGMALSAGSHDEALVVRIRHQGCCRCLMTSVRILLLLKHMFLKVILKRA